MIKHTLTVAAVSLDIAWGDRAENLYNMRRIARELHGRTDIIVLPELFSTGFLTDPGQMNTLSDSDSRHEALDAMRIAAAEANAAVCGSVLWHTDSGEYVNRCLFVEPSGETSVYDKRHLFCKSSEPRLIKAGSHPGPVIRFRGCNVAMAVCYDLRFPCWLRNTVTRPYDLLLIPSNWPQARQTAWNVLLCARAIENQAYVVGANRSGSDDNGCYDAMTRIYTPQGETVGTSDPRLGTIMATVDIGALARLRADFPVLRDADPCGC